MNLKTVFKLMRNGNDNFSYFFKLDCIQKGQTGLVYTYGHLLQNVLHSLYWKMRYSYFTVQGVSTQLAPYASSLLGEKAQQKPLNQSTYKIQRAHI